MKLLYAIAARLFFVGVILAKAWEKHPIATVSVVASVIFGLYLIS